VKPTRTKSAVGDERRRSTEERNAERERSPDDPDFGEVVTAQERNRTARLIVKTHNIDTVPNGSYTAIKNRP
jgi:hypothetical protein